MRILYFLLLFPLFSFAFSIDSMIKFSEGDDFFLVSGNNKEREYIYVTLSELISDKNNKYHEVLYDANNITQWPISASPSEIIVSTGEQVRVRINKNYERIGKDRIFGVMFNPDTLNNKNGNLYNVPFGYKAWLIIPGTDPLSGSVDVNRVSNKNRYFIRNDTNKVIDISVEYCDERDIKNCKSQLIVRPYAEKTIEINSDNKPVEFNFFVGTGANKKSIKRKIL